MAFIYCEECGSKLEYKTSKPKYCSGCGYNIAAREGGSPQIDPGDDAQDSEKSEGVPKIQGLDYEVSTAPNQQVTLGSVLGTNKDGAKIEGRGRSRKISADPLADSIKECSSTRDSKQIDE